MPRLLFISLWSKQKKVNPRADFCGSQNNFENKCKEKKFFGPRYKIWQDKFAADRQKCRALYLRSNPNLGCRTYDDDVEEFSKLSYLYISKVAVLIKYCSLMM